MFKKTLACMLAVCLSVIALLTLLQPSKQSVAEESEEHLYLLEGFVISTEEDAFLLQTTDGQQYLVHWSNDPFDPVMPGDAVRLTYDGMLSRSIPPQVTASEFLSRKETGTVEEVSEDGQQIRLLTQDDTLLTVSMDDLLQGETGSLTEGEEVTVYLDLREEEKGLTALHVRPASTLQGTILGVEDGMLELETENGLVLVRISESTLQLVSPEVGRNVCVVPSGTMMLSEPAVYTALEVYSAD